MKPITFSLIVVLGLLFGCKKDSTVVTPTNDALSGSVKMVVDKSTIPQGVVQIVSELTRSGFDKRTGVINILGDSTADISFSNVPIGVWHLKVDAKDGGSVTLYTGETDATVKQDSITQISLTLNPVGGGIHVVVSWGALKKLWADNTKNPILTSSDTTLHAKWIFGPQIINDDGVYRMWYASTTPTSNARVVGYVTSSDGTVWTSGSATPVLKPGTSSDWDYNNVGVGAVIKDGALYRMYYNNSSDFSNPWECGLATSTDALHWTKYPGPILTQTLSWEHSIGAAEVMKVGNLFYLYYSSGTSIGLATSTDGVTFTKFPEPVLTETASWETGGVSTPSIIYEGGIYTMVYMVANSSGIGMATSTDGKVWIKDSRNPVFTLLDVANQWTKNKIAYLCYRKIGAEYRVYYSGYDAVKNLWMIGYAKKL